MADNDSSPTYSQDQSDEFLAAARDEMRRRAAAWSKTAPAAAAPEPLTDFDRTFQATVGPRLVPFIELGGYLLQLELESFSEAHARVMAAARKYGAGHLSDSAFFALDSWIDVELLRAVDAPPRSGVVTPEQLARIRRECL